MMKVNMEVVQPLLEEIDSLRAELEGLLPMEQSNKDKLDRKFRLEFNYNSNHLEGNTLTYEETELLVIFDETKGNHTFREYEEMKAHDVAYEYIQKLAKESGDRSLSEQDIKHLNKIILVKPFWKEAQTLDGLKTRRLIQIGDYKQHPNSVILANGEMHHYASPADTPILMGELMQWYRDQLSINELHAILLAAELHYRFVCIHPFDDGNGRVARLLMNYVLACHHLPPVIVKSSDKGNYLRALRQADVNDITGLYSYLSNQLLWSLKISLKAAKGQDIEEDDDLDKEIELQMRSIHNKSKPLKSNEYTFASFEFYSQKVLVEILLTILKFESGFEKISIRISRNGNIDNKGATLNTYLKDHRQYEGFKDFIYPNDKPTLKEIQFNNKALVYASQLSSIIWKISLNELKGRGNNVAHSMEVHVQLKFEADSYFFNTAIDEFEVSSHEYNYGQTMLQSDIIDIKRKLARSILEEIRARTQEKPNPSL